MNNIILTYCLKVQNKAKPTGSKTEHLNLKLLVF